MTRRLIPLFLLLLAAGLAPQVLPAFHVTLLNYIGLYSLVALGLVLIDRKSTRLNSSHGYISYAVFCLKKKNNNNKQQKTNKQKTNKTIPSLY